MKQFIISALLICSTIPNFGNGMHHQQVQEHPINQYVQKIANIGANETLFRHNFNHNYYVFKESNITPCDLANGRKHFDVFQRESNFIMGLDSKFVAKHQEAIWDAKCQTYLISPFYVLGHASNLLNFTPRLSADGLFFMAVNIIIAFTYLHKTIENTGIKFQYLGPTDIIIGDDGFALIDFGFEAKAKYIAPELAAKKGWTTVTDWWLVGAILYEMATGNPPTGTSDGSLSIPGDWVKSPEGVAFANLVTSLLQKNPAQRLGADPNTGRQAIYSHDYFRLRKFTSQDWEGALLKIHNRAWVVPPYIPQRDQSGLLHSIVDKTNNSQVLGKPNTAPHTYAGVSWPPPQNLVDVNGHRYSYDAMKNWTISG